MKQVKEPALWKVLSGQQWQVAQLIAQGLTNREIGERMLLSPRTIQSHVGYIMDKLHLRSRLQIALSAHDTCPHCGGDLS